jgi:hypothetical protein
MLKRIGGVVVGQFEHHPIAATHYRRRRWNERLAEARLEALKAERDSATVWISYDGGTVQ